VPAPEPRYGFLSDALLAADAAAFVHVADRRDPTMRYLARTDRPGTVAFCYADGDACLLAPEGGLPGARRAFPGEYVYGPDDLDGATPGQRAVSLLDSYGVSGPVLTPRRVPHDAALYLENAGHPVSSSAAVAEERAQKGREEVECIERVADAAAAAIEDVRAKLRDAEPAAGGRKLRADGRTLTTGFLRRETDAALAKRGCAGAGETVVAAGRGATDPGFSGDVPLTPGSPVALALSPRGSRGYHAALTRTFSPATEGGWDRRAFLAVESALEAGVQEVSAGATAASVRKEVLAELGAFGFGDAALDLSVAGVGLAPREAPEPDDRLLEGHTLAVRAGVADPEKGPVRLAETVRVTEAGCDRLTPGERSLVA
jgi:Xaa-Pro aminopeptidase